MRKLILLAIMVCTFHSPALADNPIIKLGKGLESIVTSPMEFPTQFSRLDNDGYSAFVSTVGGTFFGLGGMVTRILVGAAEVVTFLFPIPEDYRPIMEKSPMEDYQIQKQILQQRAAL